MDVAVWFVLNIAMLIFSTGKLQIGRRVNQHIQLNC